MVGRPIRMSVWPGPAPNGLGGVAVGLSDMCLLDRVDEESFVENLALRFRHDLIYVSFIYFQTNVYIYKYDNGMRIALAYLFIIY